VGSLTDKEISMSVTSSALERLPIASTDIASDVSDEEVTEQEVIYYPITQRDPSDVCTILRLSVCSLVFAVLSIALAGLLIYRLMRSAELVVVERTPQGDRVVGDDRHYTLHGPVQITTDSPGDGDKKYLASKWAESFFRIDPQTRRNDIVRGLKVMTPDAAVSLVEQVKQTGEWETQRREEWQAIWKPQVITVSSDDAYKVQIVGQQEINKMIAGATQHSTRQLICTLLLRPDTAKRTEDNQNTGFRVAGIVEMKVLDDPHAATSNPAAISVAPPH
jgi:hypothetical protein